MCVYVITNFDLDVFVTFTNFKISRQIPYRNQLAFRMHRIKMTKRESRWVYLIEHQQEALQYLIKIFHHNEQGNFQLLKSEAGSQNSLMLNIISWEYKR